MRSSCCHKHVFFFFPFLSPTSPNNCLLLSGRPGFGPLQGNHKAREKYCSLFCCPRVYVCGGRCCKGKAGRADCYSSWMCLCGFMEQINLLCAAAPLSWISVFAWLQAGFFRGEYISPKLHGHAVCGWKGAAVIHKNVVLSTSTDAYLLQFSHYD